MHGVRTVNLAAKYFWLSLDKKAADMSKTLSLGQYGMTHGQPRLLDLLDEVNIKATFFVPGKVAENYLQAVAETAARGHEIACHGYEYENFSLLDGEEQKWRIAKAVTAIEAVCGRKVREKDYVMKEDAGRGWRRVVASPLPQRIVEIEAIKSLGTLPSLSAAAEAACRS